LQAIMYSTKISTSCQSDSYRNHSHVPYSADAYISPIH
jgi:hypothetical protein